MTYTYLCLGFWSIRTSGDPDLPMGKPPLLLGAQEVQAEASRHVRLVLKAGKPIEESPEVREEPLGQVYGAQAMAPLDGQLQIAQGLLEMSAKGPDAPVGGLQRRMKRRARRSSIRRLSTFRRVAARIYVTATTVGPVLTWPLKRTYN